MNKWMLNVVMAVTLTFFLSPPARAVTAWWLEPGILVEADEAVTPAGATGQTLAVTTANNSLATAKALSVGGAPVDGVIVAGMKSWYLLAAEDGPGYIRIGSTGPLLIEDAIGAAGNDSAPGPWSRKSVAPQNGAKLIETSMISITDLARIRKVPRGFVRLSTESTTPVAYRISFVSELPESRVGSAYGPGSAASQYILALANGGPLNDLYRTTRVRYTKDQAMALRERLFGKSATASQFFRVHDKDPSVDPNLTESMPVQHIILSDDQSRHWAFVIRCEQRDGLWVVADAGRDPDLSDAEVAAIVRRDREAGGNFRTGEGASQQNQHPASKTPAKPRGK
ncbi:hypothetical protein KOM00_03505 [Geomonas sp. Red69]|uniref:hypothetical protein n=1 Tax=Geomonas diazotrophica TaxID=2843197 RepID=UPI001C11033E|nr:MULTISPECIES: hypothetical protein [Geomonas]MBU5635790.1 hypothetical protein [Geomonas diazotrophica]QXE87108.1 hypothetical protein KP003_01485 [Geomonas nitrogeniifigens]